MIGPEVTVPDVTEAVVGYRTFALDRDGQFNYRLVSPNQGEPWQKAEMTARCTRDIPVPEGIIVLAPPKRHKAPQKGCSCGIYVYFDPCPVGDPPKDPYHMGYGYMHHPDTPSWHRANKVEALMSLSGTIEVHATGMRAERGRICALGTNGRLTADERIALAELAKRFDVPLVHEEQLPALATEFGRSLGPEFRPTQPKPEPEMDLVPVFAYATGSYSHAEGTSCTEARIEKKRPWWALAPVYLNGGLAAVNATFFAIWHGPVSAACIGVNVFFAAWSWRSFLRMGR